MILMNTPAPCDGLVAVFQGTALSSLQQHCGCHNSSSSPLDTKDWKGCPEQSSQLSSQMTENITPVMGQNCKHWFWKRHMEMQNNIYTHANVCALPEGIEIVKSNLLTGQERSKFAFRFKRTFKRRKLQPTLNFI